MESLNVKHGTVSGHLTGGAVDLPIADRRGHYLDMGGNFDETGAHSRTNFYEASENITARDNRRLLVRTMDSEGFSNYPSDWWHYDYGRAWALGRTMAMSFTATLSPRSSGGTLISPREGLLPSRNSPPTYATISLTINLHRLYPVTALPASLLKAHPQ